MSLSLNKPKLDNLANEIWKSAERLRGKFKAYEYQGVILPIIVIRRLECVLLAWREAKSAEVLAKRPKLPSVQQSNLNSTRYSRMFIPLSLSEQDTICAHLDEKLA
jgi:type I restriction enzyme M protein